MKKLYKVTNKRRDPRAFFDSHAGINIIVDVLKSAVTTNPPGEDEIWKVEEYEERQVGKKKNKTEVE